MYFIDDQVDFYVSVDSSAQQNTIKAYEWYLDQSLVLENNTSAFRAKVTEGKHIVGVRILTADGWSGIKTFSFNTYKFPVSLNIYGVDTLDEGGSTEYRIVRVFSDQTTEDVTDEYTLWSTGGCFDGNIFTARIDPDSDQDMKITINASKNSDVTKDVTIINTTGPVLKSIMINGLTVVNEGTTTPYAVTGTYSDGIKRDISASYTLQSSEGHFDGLTYYAPTNNTFNDTRQVTITAVQNGAIKATSVITIKDVNSKPGVLVVDFLNSPPMNMIAFIENDEVTVSHEPAYTRRNTVPSFGDIAQMYVLASDFISEGPVKWRVQFNIARLMAEYPGSENFAFHIKGRANQATGLSGAYSLKTHDAQMIMRGASGSLVPSVSGGSNYSSLVNFSANAGGGANGDFTEQTLSTIIKFNYNVPNDILTYSLSSLDYLSDEIQEVVQKNDCDQDLEGSWVTYTLPAGAFSSRISQVEANNHARKFFDSNKQQHANYSGTCADASVDRTFTVFVTGNGFLLKADNEPITEDLSVEMTYKINYSPNDPNYPGEESPLLNATITLPAYTTSIQDDSINPSPHGTISVLSHLFWPSRSDNHHINVVLSN
ncbi:DUF5977 domain-containing protein [Pedobacter endophyticus]|nr:DUF5977 domain-containing protein [Pedobacter endophyticus]